MSKVLFVLCNILFTSTLDCQIFNTVRPELTVNVNKDTKDTIDIDIANKDTIDVKKSDTTLFKRLLSLPLDQLNITSQYGMRNDPFSNKRKFHSGIDFKAIGAENIYSIMPGKIKKIGEDKKLGKFVHVSHGDFISIYGHLSEYVVTKDQIVSAGEVIGYSGSTGRSTGEHLHFTMKFKGKVINPTPIIDYIKRCEY